jgi:effector-binding domain-containing protein
MHKEVGELGCDPFEVRNAEAFWRDGRNSLWTVWSMKFIQIIFGTSVPTSGKIYRFLIINTNHCMLCKDIFVIYLIFRKYILEARIAEAFWRDSRNSLWTVWSMKIMQIIFGTSVPTSEKIYCFLITNTNHCILCMDIFVIYLIFVNNFWRYVEDRRSYLMSS